MPAADPVRPPPPETNHVADPAPAAPARPDWTWRSLLSRVREVTRADCVFAVQGEGLVVGRDGSYGRVEVERVAAHLSRSFDFVSPLTEIGSSVESLCVMFAEGRWLTAVRVAPTETQCVTIGIVGPYTIIRQDRHRIRHSFLKLFMNGLPPPEPDTDPSDAE